MSTRNIVTIFLLLTLSFSSKAQSYLGLSTMNYSGVHRLYLNPANAAGRTNPLSFSILGIGQTYDNTYADWQGEQSVISAIIDDNVQAEDLAPRNNPFNTVGLGAEFRGLGATFGLGSYIGLGITSRLRSDIQLRNTSLDLLEAMRLGLDDPRWEINKQYTNQSLVFNTNTFAEIGLTLAGQLPLVSLGENHQVYVGATVKYLQSVTASSLNIEDMTFEIRQDPDPNSDRYLYVNSVRGTMGYSYTDVNEFTIENPFKGAAGKGIGTDLGLVYERNSDVPGQKFKYRLGVSLLDIGKITYDNPEARFYSFESGDIRFTDEDAENFQQDPYGTIETKLGLTPDGTTYTAYLPTTLIIQTDYAVLPMLYIGGIYSRRIVQESFSINRGDFAALIPRLELKAVSLAVPITLKNDFEDLAIGTSLRLGPFFIGADNWLGAISEKNLARLQAYTGFSFNIGSPL